MAIGKMHCVFRNTDARSLDDQAAVGTTWPLPETLVAGSFVAPAYQPLRKRYQAARGLDLASMTTEPPVPLQDLS